MLRVASVSASPAAQKSQRSEQGVRSEASFASSEYRVIPFPVASASDDQWQSVGQAASSVLRKLQAARHSGSSSQ